MLRKILNVGRESIKFKSLMILNIAAIAIIAEMPQWVGKPIPVEANGVPIKSTHFTKDNNYLVSLGDWDNDGDLDLFVTEDNFEVWYDTLGHVPKVFLHENIGDKYNYEFAERVNIKGLSESAFIPAKSG